MAAVDLVNQGEHLGKFVFHVGIPFIILDEYAYNIVPQDAKQDAKLSL